MGRTTMISNNPIRATQISHAPQSYRRGVSVEDQFARQVQEMATRLQAFFRQRQVSETEVEDLVQDAILKATINHDKYNSSFPLWPWDHSIPVPLPLCDWPLHKQFDV